MEYKTSYTKEEVDDLVQWFSTHEFENQIDLGSGINIPDLKKTLPNMLHIAQTKHENRTFSGQVNLAFRIRDELIKQGKVKE